MAALYNTHLEVMASGKQLHLSPPPGKTEGVEQETDSHMQRITPGD